LSVLCGSLSFNHRRERTARSAALATVSAFVRLVAQGKDEFHLFRLSDVQDILTKHSQWLGQHGGRRPKSPESMRTSVATADLAQYRAKWDLLSEGL